MKKYFIKFTCLLIIFILMFSLMNTVNAIPRSQIEASPKPTNSTSTKPEDTTKDVDAYSESAQAVKDYFSGSDVTQGDAGQNIKEIMAAILDVVRLIGAAAAVIVLMIIGAKYLIASAGERADIKKYAMNYVIGALILFGASGILSIIKNIINVSVSSD